MSKFRPGWDLARALLVLCSCSSRALLVLSSCSGLARLPGGGGACRPQNGAHHLKMQEQFRNDYCSPLFTYLASGTVLGEHGRGAAFGRTSLLGPWRGTCAGLARDLRGTCSELARSKDFELDFAIRALRLRRMLWFSTCPFRTVFAAHLLNFRACAEFSRTQSQKHARNVAPRGGADEVRKKCGRCAEDVRKKCGRSAEEGRDFGSIPRFGR